MKNNNVIKRLYKASKTRKNLTNLLGYFGVPPFKSPFPPIWRYACGRHAPIFLD